MWFAHAEKAAVNNLAHTLFLTCAGSAVEKMPARVLLDPRGKAL